MGLRIKKTGKNLLSYWRGNKGTSVWDCLKPSHSPAVHPLLSNWGSAGDVQINHKKTVPYPAARTWDGLSVLGVISGFPSKSLRHLYAILVFASDAMHQNISTSNIVKPLRYVCLRNFGLPHQDRKNHRRTPIPNFIVPHNSFVFNGFWNVYAISTPFYSLGGTISSGNHACMVGFKLPQWLLQF